ncbi:MAG: alkaline phosphatase D family protein [Tenacibaculum sp.]
MIDKSRREFVKQSFLCCAATIVSPNFISCKNSVDEQKTIYKKLPLRHFDQGVASFDPTANGVIIWTRYSNKKNTPIVWQVATDKEFKKVLRSGEVIADASTDYTIAVELQNLSTGLKLFYRFIDQVFKGTSVIGETITLAVNPQQISFAVCSCSNFQAGLFNTYHAMANSDADIVLHLGDYIYEYAVGQYGTNSFTNSLNRKHKPSYEVIDLEGYRARYKQYRSDKNLQLLHQKKPFMCVWDDHEICNNTYLEGAQNHNDGEGNFYHRLADAVQAYSEYIPVKSANTKLNKIIYRNVKIGDLINLFMIDTRVIGRDKQVNIQDYIKLNGKLDYPSFNAVLWDSNRSTLGQLQKNWLITELEASDTLWQVFGQQTLMGTMTYPFEFLPYLSRIVSEAPTGFALSDKTKAIIAFQNKLSELVKLKKLYLTDKALLTEEQRKRITTKVPYNLDAWDGFMAEREEVLSYLKGKKFICLAGDTHNAWHNEIYNKEGVFIGHEIATTSVNGPGLEGYLGSKYGSELITEIEQNIEFMVEHLQYFEASRRGFLKATFTKKNCIAEWIYIDTIWSENYSTALGYKKVISAFN